MSMWGEQYVNGENELETNTVTLYIRLFYER